MSEPMTLKEFAEKLESCADDEIDAAETLVALMTSTFSSDEEVVNDAMHFLNHFAADTDIRVNDKEYDNLQRAQLRAYADKIRQIR